MHRLTPEELKYRLQLDYRVCRHMFGTVFSGEAYRSNTDLEQRRNPITSPSDGHLAKKYRVDFHVRTLVGAGQFSDLTTIGFDLDVSNYPHHEPATWIISGKTPYSPHFKQGAPVCIGGIWRSAQGYMLLGQLLVHIARLLNWDEIATSPGYVGWNGEAIAYYKRVYNGKPLNARLQYPLLPPDLYGINANSAKPTTVPFRPSRPIRNVDPSLFKGKG